MNYFNLTIDEKTLGRDDIESEDGDFDAPDSLMDASNRVYYYNEY